MSREPIVASTLDDLSDICVDFTIPRPDGQKIKVSMRTLTVEEVTRIRRGIAWPKPPVKDLVKIDGRVVEQYDEADAEYQNALEDANNEQAYRILLASLKLDIPGADDEERVANLKKRLGMWAFNHLITASANIHFPQVSEVAQTALSFRQLRNSGASGDEGAGADAGAVAESIEG